MSNDDSTWANRLFSWHDSIYDDYSQTYLSKSVKFLCNGQRLKNGEQRPKPFYVKFIDNRCLLMYNRIMQKQIFRRMIYGAYSRKYDKVRKKLKQRRKRRLF